MLIKLDECRRLRLAWFMTLWEEPVPREDIWEWHNNCHHLPNRWEFYWQRISLQSCYYVQILNIKQQSSIQPTLRKRIFTGKFFSKYHLNRYRLESFFFTADSPKMHRNLILFNHIAAFYAPNKSIQRLTKVFSAIFCIK